MARRELIASKKEKLSDKPESYLVWKESFENMMGVRMSSSKKKLSLLAEYTTGNAKILASTKITKRINYKAWRWFNGSMEKVG